MPVQEVQLSLSVQLVHTSTGLVGGLGDGLGGAAKVLKYSDVAGPFIPLFIASIDILYCVPDPRLSKSRFPGVARWSVIELKRVKKIPILGKVVGVKFQGSGDATEVTKRLNQDSSLTGEVLEKRRSGNHTIEIDVRRQCWLLSAASLDTDYKTVRGDDQTSLERELRSVFGRALNPEKQRWEFFTLIAHHLLAAPLPA